MNQMLTDAIRQCRMGTLILHAQPGTHYRIQQQRHAFQFGTAVLPSSLTKNRKYQQYVQTYFNTAFPGNAFKWACTEHKQGHVSYDEADSCLAWCEQHNFDTRGHCVFYSTDIHIQRWVRELSHGDRLAAMERRARGVARHFKGRVPEWDLNNEMLDGVDYFRAQYGDGIIRCMAMWMKEEDPDIVLYLNEHDILTGGDVNRYVELIEHLLESDVPIGGIGCQGHFDYPVDTSQVTATLDRLGQFGLPIKVTECDIGIPLKLERYRGVRWIRGAEKDKDLHRYRAILAAHGEEYEHEKAASLTDLYTRLFSHPAVAGINLWGFWEREHWRGKGALLKHDFSPWPSGLAYMDLVRRHWWTHEEGVVDESGCVQTPAFLGTHQITIDKNTCTVDLADQMNPKHVSTAVLQA